MPAGLGVSAPHPLVGHRPYSKVRSCLPTLEFNLCHNAFITLWPFLCHSLPVSHRHFCLGQFPAVPVGVPGGARRAVICIIVAHLCRVCQFLPSASIWSLFQFLIKLICLSYITLTIALCLPSRISHQAFNTMACFCWSYYGQASCIGCILPKLTGGIFGRAC